MTAARSGVATASDAGRPPAGTWTLAAWLLCLVGAGWRIAVVAQSRSLWYDEAALTLNLAERGFLALARPLDYQQSAAPVFLWVERLALSAFGPSEWALRLLPLAAGIATVALTWRAGRRLLPAPIALIAVALVALSPTLVRYSAEVKPYATDAFVTVLLVDRALAARDGAGARAWWWLAVVGAIAPLASTPSVFVLGGVLAFLAVSALFDADRRLASQAMRRTALLAAGWGASVAVLLATFFRPLVGESTPIGKFMHWYWAANFVNNEPPGIVTKARVLVWAVLPQTFFGDGAFPGATTVLAGVLVVGLLALVITRRFPVALLVAVPMVALVVASMLRIYPIAERLALFAAPLSALAIAAAALVLTHRHLRRWEGAGAALATALVLLLGTRGAYSFLRSDVGRQESRALIGVAARERARGIPVWVSGSTEMPWRLYASSATGMRPTPPPALEVAAGRAFAPDLIVGKWYDYRPEQILPDNVEHGDVIGITTWGTTEAARVRAVARPCALLLVTVLNPRELPELVEHLTRLGGTVAVVGRAPGAELARVCFA